MLNDTEKMVDGGLLIIRTSVETGIERSMILPITLDQYNNWKNGSQLIQEVFPNLTFNEREFILTGLSEEEYDELVFNEELFEDYRGIEVGDEFGKRMKFGTTL